MTIESSNATVTDTTADAGPILAAGGIVMGIGADAGKIAVIRRERHGPEFALPKGKVNEGESISAAAMREIKEETGCTVTLTGFADLTRYQVEGRQKVVFYFRMTTLALGELSDTKEVVAVHWMSPTKAIQILTHAEDRALLARVFGQMDLGDVGLVNRLRGMLRALWRQPETDRLANAIAHARVRLGTWQRCRAAATAPADRQCPADSWAAETYLSQAEDHLRRGRLQAGWDALQAAEREIATLDPIEAQRVAEALRFEKEKIDGWRRKAIEQLLPKEGISPETRNIVGAMALRDDEFRTTYFKIAMKRFYLRCLTAMLAVLLTILLILSFCGVFNVAFKGTPFEDGGVLLAVVVFGVMGAGVSVIQGLISAGINDRIPSQKVAAFAVMTRPVIGAVAAVAGVTLVKAIGIGNAETMAALLGIAFSAGYSERFIVGAVDRLAKAQGGN